MKYLIIEKPPGRFKGSIDNEQHAAQAFNETAEGNHIEQGIVMEYSRLYIA